MTEPNPTIQLVTITIVLSGALLIVSGLISFGFQYRSDWVTSECLSLAELPFLKLQTHYLGLELVTIGIVLELVGVCATKIFLRAKP